MVDCNSENCLKHGNLRVRGVVKTGFVRSTKAKNTAVVEVPYVYPITKFERFEKRKSKVHIHIPPCETANVHEGDLVEFGECRKISKTKSHVFMRKMKKTKIQAQGQAEGEEKGNAKEKRKEEKNE